MLINTLVWGRWPARSRWAVHVVAILSEQEATTLPGELIIALISISQKLVVNLARIPQIGDGSHRIPWRVLQLEV